MEGERGDEEGKEGNVWRGGSAQPVFKEHKEVARLAVDIDERLSEGIAEGGGAHQGGRAL